MCLASPRTRPQRECRREAGAAPFSRSALTALQIPAYRGEPGDDSSVIQIKCVQID